MKWRRRIAGLRRGSREQPAGGAARTAEYWGEDHHQWRDGGGLHWMELPPVRERVNRKISGDPRQDGYGYFVDFLARRGRQLPLGRSLTLGCGFGALERGLHPYGLAAHYDALDISEGAIRAARDEAAKAGLANVSYEVADLDRLELPENTYDVIFGVQAVHHFLQLERVFEAVRGALKSDGFFVLDEYVGPNRLQWTERQLRVINGLLTLLPDEYLLRYDGRTKTRLRPYTEKEMIETDPSEAARSRDIMPLLKEYFDIVEQKDYGGTVLHPLLDGIAFNFGHGEPGARMLQMLFEVEDAMIDSGWLDSDFTFVIACASSWRR